MEYQTVNENLNGSVSKVGEKIINDIFVVC